MESFAVAFRKAYAMDFYITKYQGKMMEALTPLFQTMLGGIQRLEQQEIQEDEEKKLQAATAQEVDNTDPLHKKRKTKEDLERRARRVCIRLASMANRCFWLSTCEVTVHILTGGDCLQSHTNVRLFTRQLQWAMQQCKRQLNHEALHEDTSTHEQSVQAVTVRVRTSVDGDGAAQPLDEEDEDDDVEIVDMHASTTSTNTSDDFAHRGRKLQTMPFYVYRMYVRRIPRPGRARAKDPSIFPFATHYALSSNYVQEVFLTNINVPTIDGFQCPTWNEDPEQNSLLKALLFTPWQFIDPMTCGDCAKFAHMLSNCSCAAHHGAAQPVHPSARKFTFERSWRLRCSELHVLAQRAETRCHAARKKLVLADTTLFAERKEPHGEIQKGEATKRLLRMVAVAKLQRTMPAEALRRILAFSDQVHAWHDQQCTLAEFCAQIAVNVVAHIELAAEARIKPPTKKKDDAEVDEDTESEAEAADHNRRRVVELVDVGGGGDDDVQEDTEDVPFNEVSSFPIHGHQKVIGLTLQQSDLQSLQSKRRFSYSDKQLMGLDLAYGAMLKQNFAKPVIANDLVGMCFKDAHGDMIALQRHTISLMKKQANPDDLQLDDAGDAWLPNSDATQPAEEEQRAKVVPLPLALQGPGAVAWKLVTDARCTEEQTDAVALLAFDFQKRSDARPDKTTHMLPVATAENNHRAVWLGGGGVGKTYTLSEVIEPLAETFFGPDGYSATAQSNQAAQNLGPRGRTLHAANGLLMTDTLQTARLRLNPQTQKKMLRLTGSLGVDVIDELGCVSGTLLHADALRKTYGRSLKHDLQTTAYMKPQETWGRMPCKLLCGDFYQLPPVPATASLLASTKGQTYEHQQGRKLLADMEYVVDFVQMQRFDDKLQMEVLEAMRTEGGKTISEESWRAIVATQIRNDEPATLAAASNSGASQPAAWDARLRQARGWYESAYEWRIVSYAMHANARLDAHDAGKVLFYIPAVDTPAVRLGKDAFDEMRAFPNISQSAKLPGVLPTFIGMEMILTESFLPPKYVRGTACEVVGLEPHPKEPPIEGRDSITTHGCVVLHDMPKCVYVRIIGSKDSFLQGGTPGAAQPSGIDMKGMLAIKPQARPWKFTPSADKSSTSVSRTQIPLLPRKQCTLHGVQGKTADPGFIVHWTFPPALTKESKWLAYYVSLSRPRSFSKLLSHGLPDRAIIEAGPPEDIVKAFKELFVDKIASTKIACAKARKELGWPIRQL